MKRKTLYTCQRGAAGLEFALVFPLLLLVVFGIIEFATIFYNKAVLTNASREGARVGVLYRTDADKNRLDPDPTEIKNTIINYCSTNLINYNGNAVLTAGDIPAPTWDDDYLTVTVNLPYGFLVLPNFIGGSPTLTISAQTIMRRES